jgi:hypothetical protein
MSDSDSIDDERPGAAERAMPDVHEALTSRGSVGTVSRVSADRGSAEPTPQAQAESRARSLRARPRP